MLNHEAHSNDVFENFPEDINEEFDDEDSEYDVPTRVEEESYKKYRGWVPKFATHKSQFYHPF